MENRKTNEMKKLVSIIVGIAAAIGALLLVNMVVNAITADMENKDLRIILRVALWVVFSGIAFLISFVVGTFFGALTEFILTKKRRR